MNDAASENIGTGSGGSWLFIGAGNMARAIAGGARDAGVLDATAVAAFDPTGAPDGAIGRVFNEVDGAAAWLAEQQDPAVIVATKPQMFGEVCAAWRPVLDRWDPLLVASILAGTKVDTLRHGLGNNARVTRVMPNTPIRLGLGMSAIAPGPDATAGDVARVECLFGSVGETLRIDESLMDAFTGVAGSGPAYVFYLAEAMVEAATRLGFDRDDALRVVRQTVVGAGTLLARSGESPESLRNAVTSKGGTTASATSTLENAGVRHAVIAAIEAAERRGAELAG